MGYRCHGVDNKKSVDVGLKILIQKLNSQSKGDPNNVLIMCGSRFTKVKPIFHMTHNTEPRNSPGENNPCFLKYCFLCNKTLRLDKEVYMYKGDQGFCSVECRNRQIYLDEIKELENCTKKVSESFRRCGDGSRCSETMALLKDYEKQHKKLSYSKNQPIFTLS